MATITITDLTRCAGGNHYAVTCDVDGAAYQIDFDTRDLERRKIDAGKLSQVVLPVVLDEINAVRDAAGARGATLADEQAAVVGKVIEPPAPVSKDVKQVEGGD